MAQRGLRWLNPNPNPNPGPTRWDGLWLNEGFAAFMEHFCIDALYPEYRIWEQVRPRPYLSHI